MLKVMDLPKILYVRTQEKMHLDLELEFLLKRNQDVAFCVHPILSS